MFPNEQLTDLSRRKALLQAHIGLCRVECRATAADLARPLALVDRGVEFWRRISPFTKLAALPAGLLLSRFLGRGRPAGRGRGGKFATLMSLLPLVVRGARLLGALRSAAAAAKNAPPTSGRP
jgi:hypothetical protein